MYLPWTHWKPVKLRALCFWAPGAVAAFTWVQCCSGDGTRHFPALQSQHNMSWHNHSDLELLLLTVSLWYPFWSELCTPLPRALPNLDVSHFLLFTATQAGPGKRSVSCGCVQLSDLQETVLLLSILFSRELRKKAQSQVPVLMELHHWMICSP